MDLTEKCVKKWTGLKLVTWWFSRGSQSTGK